MLGLFILREEMLGAIMLSVIMLRVVILTVDFLLPDQQPHHLHHRGNLPTGLQRRHDSALFDGSL
jgi:hypothetical protein